MNLSHAKIGIYKRNIGQLCDLESKGENVIHIGIGQRYPIGDAREDYEFRSACHSLANRMESTYFNSATCKEFKDPTVKMAPEVLKLEWDPRRCFIKSVIQNYNTQMRGFLNGENSNRNTDGHKFSSAEMRELILPLEKACVGYSTFTEKINCLKIQIKDSVNYFHKAKKNFDLKKGEIKLEDLCSMFNKAEPQNVKFLSKAISNQKRSAADKNFPAWQECRDLNLEKKLNLCQSHKDEKISSRHKACINQALRYLGSDEKKYNQDRKSTIGYFYLLRELDKLSESAKELDLSIHLCRNRFDFVSLRTGERFVGRLEIDETRCLREEIDSLLNLESFFDLLKEDYKLSNSDRKWLEKINNSCAQKSMEDLIPKASMPENFITMATDFVKGMGSDQESNKPKEWNEQETIETLKNALLEVANDQKDPARTQSIQRRAQDEEYLKRTSEYFMGQLNKIKSSETNAKKHMAKVLESSFNSIFDKYEEDKKKESVSIDSEEGVEEVNTSETSEKVKLENIDSLNAELLAELGVKDEKAPVAKLKTDKQMEEIAKKGNKGQLSEFLLQDEVRKKYPNMSKADFKIFQDQVKDITAKIKKAIKNKKLDPQKDPRETIESIIAGINDEVQRIQEKPFLEYKEAGGLLQMLATGKSDLDGMNKFYTSIVESAGIKLPEGYKFGLEKKNTKDRAIFYSIFMGEKFDLQTGGKEKDPFTKENIIVDSKIYFQKYLIASKKKIPKKLSQDNLLLTNNNVTDEALKKELEQIDNKNGPVSLHYLDYFDVALKRKVPVGAVMRANNAERLLTLYDPIPIPTDKDLEDVEKSLRAQGKDPKMAKAILAIAAKKKIPFSFLSKSPELLLALFKAAGKIDPAMLNMIASMDLSKVGDVSQINTSDLDIDLSLPEGKTWKDLSLNLDLGSVDGDGPSFDGLSLSLKNLFSSSKKRKPDALESQILEMANYEKSRSEETGKKQDRPIIVMDKSEVMNLPYDIGDKKNDANLSNLLDDRIFMAIENAKKEMRDDQHFYFSGGYNYDPNLIIIDKKLHHVVKPGAKIAQGELHSLLEKLAHENQNILDKSDYKTKIDHMLDNPFVNLANYRQGVDDSSKELLDALVQYTGSGYHSHSGENLKILKIVGMNSKAKNTNEYKEMRKKAKKFMDAIEKKPEAFLALMRMNLPSEEHYIYLDMIDKYEELFNPSEQSIAMELNLALALNEKFQIASAKKSDKTKVHEGSVGQELITPQKQVQGQNGAYQKDQEESPTQDEKIEVPKEKGTQEGPTVPSDQTSQKAKKEQEKKDLILIQASSQTVGFQGQEFEKAQKSSKKEQKIKEAKSDSGISENSPYSISETEWFKMFDKIASMIHQGFIKNVNRLNSTYELKNEDKEKIKAVFNSIPKEAVPMILNKIEDPRTVLKGSLKFMSSYIDEDEIKPYLKPIVQKLK